jgi:hypothetical protein
MNTFNNFLNYLGLTMNVSEESSAILLLSISHLIMAVIGFLCFINIAIYFIVVYFLDEKLLSKISEYTMLLKLVEIYRKTRLMLYL